MTFATWLAASGCGRLHFQSLGDAAADRDGAAGGFAMDPAFGSNGVVVIDNGGIANLAYSIQGIAVQPDGRIVVVGLGGTAANTDTLVVRLLDDGSLDPSFGSGGVVLIDVFAQEEGRSVAIQPDGKLVIGSGGGDVSGPPDSDVIRLAPDGSLDPTFGTTSAGVSIVDFPGSIDSPNGAYLGADGKIAFGGQSYSATTSWDFATSLLDSDGSLDPSFGTGGVVATDLFGSDEFGSPVAMLADGRIYNAGSTYHGANNFDAVLLRLATDGTLDASFASVGYVTVDFEDQVDRATMAALDSSQRIDLVGHTNEGPSQDGFAMRFLDDGSRDAAFAAGDGFIVDLGGAEELHAVLPLADGRVLLAGWSNHSGNNKFLVVVLQQDGTPDASVGSDGLLEFDVVPGQDNEAWGLARDPDGRILVFGSTSAGAEDDLAIIRLLP